MISPISGAGTLSAINQLNRNQVSLAETFRRLASGKRINTGKDDPAGLIASERLKAEIASLDAETRALERADANARITEGHGSEVSTMLRELDALVVASANSAGLSDAEIAANQTQIDSLSSSIQRFAGNAITSLDRISLPGDGNADVTALYEGAIAAAASVRSGGTNDLASGNFEDASTAIGNAITSVAIARGTVGTYQKNVIAPQVRSNRITVENLTESNSRIADADFAKETSNAVRQKLLVKAGVLNLKIAQQQAATVLDLLK